MSAGEDRPGEDDETHKKASEDEEYIGQRGGDTRQRDERVRDEGGDDGGGLSSTAAVVVSALVGLVVAGLAYWWVGWRTGSVVFFEEASRVAPTVEGGGVGTDWVVGNTVPWLDALIAIVHAADVIMGVFILIMVFIHWAAFRRLAAGMRPPTAARRGDTIATDGSGTAQTSSGEESESR